VVVAVAFIVLLEQWGFSISALIAGLGVGALAVSLAAQDTLSNFFAFTAIAGDRPFLVGDYIKTVDVEGTVENVGLRSTRIRQLDQALVSVPNSKLANSAITNWSRVNKRWINLTIGIPYTATPAQTDQVVTHIRGMLNSRTVVEQGSVQVFLFNIGVNSLEILIRAYVTLSDWSAFQLEKEQIQMHILRIIADAGLSILGPSSTLFIQGVDGQPAFTQDLREDHERDPETDDTRDSRESRP
jgi:MscS family membrane protein